MRASCPVDAHLGVRLRERRRALRISQDSLAAGFNVSFQQIQKYEIGANRISASTLYELSKMLDIPVGWFFEDFEVGPADPPSTQYIALLSGLSHEDLELVKRLVAILRRHGAGTDHTG